MTKPSYALWRAELKEPVPESDRATRTNEPASIIGFWRIQGARTKPSYPVAIWPQDGASGPVIFFMVGAGKVEGESMFDTLTAHDRVQDFLHNGSWLKCSAVSEDAYHAAMETGYWADDRQPARQMTKEQKVGVDLSTGGNNPPLDQSLADQIEAAAATAADIEVIDQASADKATGALDRLRLLLQKAEAERVSEKAPFLQGGKDVDARWGAIAQPGETAKNALEKRRKVWLRAEQSRLDALAAEETRKRNQAAREEAERIAAAENARRAAEAEQLGQEPAETVKPEEIEVAVAPVEAPRAKAGTAFGRASGLKKVKVGVITDKAKFVAAITEQPDFIEFLNAKVARLAKANVLLDGMTIKEELQ